MVEMLVELEFDMQAILDSNLHLHLCGSLSLLNITIVVQHSEVDLLHDCGLHVPANLPTDEVSNPPSYSIECLVLFLKIGELELELFIISEDASWFQLLRQRVEFCA